MTATGPAGQASGVEQAPSGKFAFVTNDALCVAADQLHAGHMAVMHEFLEVIRAIHRSGQWIQDGSPHFAQWLVARYSVELSTAREWVRMAESLADLPAIDAVVAQGRLSLDQLAPLTRLATPETDEDLASRAQGWTAQQTRALAARAQAPKVTDANDAHDKRRLRWWSDDNVVHLKGQLPVDQGTLITNVLTRMASDSPPDPERKVYETFEARAADALVELASLHVGDDADADRATVVVHVDAGRARRRRRGGRRDGARSPDRRRNGPTAGLRLPVADGGRGRQRRHRPPGSDHPVVSTLVGEATAQAGPGMPVHRVRAHALAPRSPSSSSGVWADPPIRTTWPSCVATTIG